jgi:hypothetical protein
MRILDDVRLVPVVELVPTTFATQGRPSPRGTGAEMPHEWERYWRDSLADSGVVGVPPLRSGSWHVAADCLRDPDVLRLILRVIVEDWGGAESLTGPDADPVLSGGMALVEGNEVLVEPTCCVDLRNLSDWRGAAAYGGLGWQTLWIGHPWLYVRFDGTLLLVSDQQESEPTGARWAVAPPDLERAVAVAEAELAAFADWLRPALAPWAGAEAAAALARRLAGLGE